MEQEKLDELLASSSPETRLVATVADTGSMIAQARQLTRPAPRRARRATWIVVGSLAASASVIGGVAVASSMMPQGYGSAWEDADFVHTFVLPSGRECTARIMVVDDNGGRSLEGLSVDASQRLATHDLWATLNIDTARDRDTSEAKSHPDQTLVIDENGRLGDAPISPAERTADDVYANVLSLALDDAITRELTSLGAAPGEVQVWDSIRCEAVTG